MSLVYECSDLQGSSQSQSQSRIGAYLRLNLIGIARHVNKDGDMVTELTRGDIKEFYRRRRVSSKRNSPYPLCSKSPPLLPLPPVDTSRKPDEVDKLTAGTGSNSGTTNRLGGILEQGLTKKVPGTF